MARKEAAAEEPVRLLAASELGQLRVLTWPGVSQLSQEPSVEAWLPGASDKDRAVLSLSASARAVAVGRLDGSIDVLCALSGRRIGTIEPDEAGAEPETVEEAKALDEAAEVVGVYILERESAGDEGADKEAPRPEGVEAGEADAPPPPSPQVPLRILRITRGGTASTFELRAGAGAAAGAGGGAGDAGGEGAAASSDGSEDEDGGASAPFSEIDSFKVTGDVCSTAYDPESGSLAVGSRGAEARLYRLTDGSTVFHARGGKANNLRLVEKPWISAVTLVTAPEGAPALPTLVAGTGLGHKVRVYSPSAGRRPRADKVFGQARVTAAASHGRRAWLADGLGHVAEVDAATGERVFTLRGAKGGVRGLAVLRASATGPLLVATVGLDRFLRLYDADRRRRLGRTYLKTHQNAVAFLPPLPPKEEESAAEASASPEGGLLSERSEETQGTGGRGGPDAEPASNDGAAEGSGSELSDSGEGTDEESGSEEGVDEAESGDESSEGGIDEAESGDESPSESESDASPPPAVRATKAAALRTAPPAARRPAARRPAAPPVKAAKKAKR